MKRSKKAAIIATVIFLVLVAIGFAFMVIRNAPYSGSMRFGIFEDISELQALEKYAVSDSKPKDDTLLKNLTVESSWIRTLDIDEATCTVRAYTFATHDDAASYYKKASHRTEVTEGANGSASAGGFFGKAHYVTMNGENVLFIEGKSFAEIAKALDAFFEACPEAAAPFAKE